MQQYTFTKSYLKKQWWNRVASPLAILAGIVIYRMVTGKEIFIGDFFYDLAFCVVLTAFSAFKAVNAYDTLKTTNIILGEDFITAQRSDQKEVTIPFNEITEIIRYRNGSLTIHAGQWVYINIDINLEGFTEIAEKLSTVKPFTCVSLKWLLSDLSWLIILLPIAAIIILFVFGIDQWKVCALLVGFFLIGKHWVARKNPTINTYALSASWASMVIGILLLMFVVYKVL